MRKYTPQEQIDSFWNNIAITADDSQCWLWLASKKGPYGQIVVNKKNYLTHRVAWSYPNYVIPNGMEICHSCDNPICCNPKHLFLGTHKENMEDMDKKKRRVAPPAGDKSPVAKITNMQIEEIKNRYQKGNITQMKLAIEYGVTQATISYIVNNKVSTIDKARWAKHNAIRRGRK